MPILRSQLLRWSPSDYDRGNVQLPHETVPSSPSTLSPHSPLSPALYSLQRHTDSAVQSQISISTTSSSRRASIDSSYSASSDRRAQRNLERDPSWVPRPRNAFIIFRCEYARENCQSKGRGGSSSRNVAPDVDKTLSKRAAEAWKSLSVSERNRFKELAEIEKEVHARQNPGYRFRPVKRPTPTKRNLRTRIDSKPPQPLQRSRTEIPESMAVEYALRQPDSRRFSESHAALDDLPLSAPKVDSMVKVARRRSSSVPLLGTEHGQYVLPWQSPEGNGPLLLKPVHPEFLNRVDQSRTNPKSSVPVDTAEARYPDDYFWPEMFEGPESLQVPSTNPLLVHTSMARSYRQDITQIIQPIGYPQMSLPIPETQWPSWDQIPTPSSSLWNSTPSMPQPVLAPTDPRATSQYHVCEPAQPWGFDEYHGAVPQQWCQQSPPRPETSSSGDRSRCSIEETVPQHSSGVDPEPYPAIGTKHVVGLPEINYESQWMDPGVDIRTVGHDEQTTGSLLPPLDLR